MESVVVLVVALLAAVCHATSFDSSYADGVAQYRDEQWKETVGAMQKAASEYSLYTLALEDCATACASKEPTRPLDYPPEPQLYWFHSLIERASCLQGCLVKEGFAGDGGTSEEVYSKLQEGEPYNYLQMSLWNVRHFWSRLTAHACTCVCAIEVLSPVYMFHRCPPVYLTAVLPVLLWCVQLGSKKEASQAAARYAGMNPLSEMAQSNLELYRSHVGEGLSPETPPYASLYTQALVKYNEGDYGNVTYLMEQSLEEFLVQLKT